MKKYNEQEMRRKYAAWQQSGKTKEVFCKEEGIIKSTFYYWGKKFQDPQTCKTPKTSFVPLVLNQNSSTDNNRPFFRINYNSGISIDFFEVPDAGFIKELCR